MSTPVQFLSEQLHLEHSKLQSQRLAAWIGHDAERFAALMDIFLGGDYRLNQRSAWVLTQVSQKYPELVAPWLPVMVAKTRAPGVHDAVKRNVVRLLEDLDIPESIMDDLADICFRFLADPREAVAIRVFSMTVLDKICQKIPELKPELRLIIEEHIEHGTAAFKSRGNKILKKLLL